MGNWKKDEIRDSNFRRSRPPGFSPGCWVARGGFAPGKPYRTKYGAQIKGLKIDESSAGALMAEGTC